MMSHPYSKHSSHQKERLDSTSTKFLVSEGLRPVDEDLEMVD